MEHARARIMNLSQMLAEADRVVPTVPPRAAMGLLSQVHEMVILDVRDTAEFAVCHITRAVSLPRGQLEFHIEEVLPHRHHPVLLVCKAGARSLLAGRTLQTMGYIRVFALAGGMEAWMDAGLPVTRLGDQTQVP